MHCAARQTLHIKLLMHYLLLAYSAAYGTASEDLLHLTTKVGVPITLPCHTNVDKPVDWSYQQFEGSNYALNIYNGGYFINGHNKHFEVISERQREYNLLIKHPKVNDTGIYTCTEDSGIGNEHLITLNVTDVTIYINYVGHLAILPCRARLLSLAEWKFTPMCDPVTTISVCKNGQLDPRFAERFRLHTSNDEINLIIINVEEQDSGDYECSDKTEMGVIHAARLVIPHQEGGVVTVVKSSVSFSCNIRLSSEVQWLYSESGSTTPMLLYDGRDFIDSSGKFAVYTSSDRQTSALQVNNAGPEHGGMYICRRGKDTANDRTFQLGIIETKLQCEVSTDCCGKPSQNFQIECRMNYSGHLKPAVTCSNEHIRLDVPEVNRGQFRCNVSISPDANVLRCSSTFNASISSHVSSYLSTLLHDLPRPDGCDFVDLPEVRQKTPDPQSVVTVLVAVCIISIILSAMVVAETITIIIIVKRRSIAKKADHSEHEEDTRKSSKLNSNTSGIYQPLNKVMNKIEDERSENRYQKPADVQQPLGQNAMTDVM